MRPFEVISRVLLTAMSLGAGRQSTTPSALQQIAVVPFAVTDASSDLAPLGEEMALTITHRLESLSGISVLGQDVLRQQARVEGSTEPLAKTSDLAAFGKKLGVDHLVTGKFHKSGNELVVECAVIDPLTGKPEQDRSFTVREALPEHYSVLLKSLADRIQGFYRSDRETAAIPAKAETTGSESFEAHQALSEGLQKASEETLASLTAARASFEEAVRRDPRFVEALAAKADAEARIARFQENAGDDSATESQDAVADALAAVKRAPYYGPAHWQLCRALELRRDYEGAALAGRIAAALSPANAEVHIDLGLALGRGKTVDRQELQTAVATTPAVSLVVPEVPQVTIENATSFPIDVKVADTKQVLAEAAVAPNSRRWVGVVPGKYSLTTTIGGVIKTQVVELTAGAAYTVDGASLTTTVAGPVPSIPSDSPALTGKSDGKLKNNAKDRADLIYIPPGLFTMGEVGQADNLPHQVTVADYWIGRTPVTVKQFHAFTDAPDGYRRAFGRAFDWEKNKPSFDQAPDHPMVNVDWYEARAYCRWAGGDLATEAQWEHAARGLGYPTFPWGKEYDASRVQAGASSTAPVTAHKSGASPYGCLDMEGNVYQWCLDGYEADLSKLVKNPVGKGKTMVVRGHSWSGTAAIDFHAARRTSAFGKPPIKIDPHLRSPGLGFRFAAPNLP